MNAGVASRFWEVLERDTEGPACWWRDEFGDEWELVRGFFVPSGGLSQVVPCTHTASTGCVYSIKRDSKGRRVGICDQGRCERREFAKRDLALFSLDVRRLGGAISGALNLEPRFEDVPGLRRTWVTGEFHPTAGYRFPIYLILPDIQDDPANMIRSLASTRREPCIVSIPTRRGIDGSLAALLEQRQYALLVLNECLTPEGPRRFRPSPEVAPLMEKFREANLPRPATGKPERPFFETPPNARWEDLVIRFQNGHEATFRFGEMAPVRLRYQDVGLIDKRTGDPTDAWRFLVDLSEASGALSPKGQPDQRKKEPHKQRASKALREAFRIEDDPFPWDRALYGWRAKFVVVPEGAE